MGNIGKIISGIFLIIFGAFIAYYSYSNKLIDLILVIGLLLILIGLAILFKAYIDSSTDKTQSFIKDQLKNFEEKTNISFTDFTRAEPVGDGQSGPLRVRREYDDYDERFLNDDGMIYVEHGDEEYVENNPSTLLKPRNLDEETSNFGNSLDFTPNYQKPIKITRKPKKRDKGFFDDGGYIYEPVEDKSESIRQALMDDEPHSPDLRAPTQKEHRDIRIDVNNPEALPIPKLLNSFIIFNNEIITTEEAFDKLAGQITKEVMLEIPSLNDLSDRFLSHIPTIYSRVIIEEFDVTDMAYMILVTSLLKQGVQIRTMPKVNTINLLTDDTYALILSNGRGAKDMEYGAIYTDINAISEIRTTFEKSWEIANELDREIILSYVDEEEA